MEPVRITKQMIDFQKSTFDNSFNAMVMLQDQTEKLARTFLEQANWLPEEGRKAIDEWIGTYKKGREDFKKVVNDSYQKVMDFFESTGKTAS